MNRSRNRSRQHSGRVSPQTAARNADLLVELAQVGYASLAERPDDRLGPGEAKKWHESELQRLLEVAKSQGWQLAAGHLVSSKVVPKLRRIARAYEERDIHAIARKVRSQRSRFSISQLHRLMSVRDQAQRDALIERAIKESWSARTVHVYVQQTRGARVLNVGRKPSVPSDPEQVLIHLESMALTWLRWTDAANDAMPPVIQKKLATVNQQIRELQKLIDARLPRPQADRVR